MASLLRKIRSNQWGPPEDGAWIPQDDIQADPLVDLHTIEGKLSVWIVDEDWSNLHRVIAALASNCDHLSNIDYVVFGKGLLAELGLNTQHEEGNTPDREANAKWHCNVVELTTRRLAALARAVYRRGEKGRKPGKHVAELLAHAIENGWIEQSGLNASLRKKIMPML